LYKPYKNFFGLLTTGVFFIKMVLQKTRPHCFNCNHFSPLPPPPPQLPSLPPSNMVSKNLLANLQILGKVCAHNDAALGRVRGEVSLTALSSGRRDVRVELHFLLGGSVERERRRGIW
jgi:hypothetical protein